MARCDDGQNTDCLQTPFGGTREYACWYCVVATFHDNTDLVDNRILCGRSVSIPGTDEHPCDPNFACPQYHITAGSASGPRLLRNAPGCAPANSGGGLGLCGCGTQSLFCACFFTNGVANLSTVVAESASEAERLLQMLGRTNISIYAKTIGQSCQATEPQGACCYEVSPGQFSCIASGQCGCAGRLNSTFHKDKTCAQIACGPSKRCCHCDWCCKVGTGGITESACTSAGGLVQSGTCPASGPCTTTNCKPCQLEGFSLAVNRTGNTQSVAGGYQPIAQIKAIDTTATTEPTYTMHASLASKDDGSQYGYAARSCNIYNRRIGGGDVTRRRAVSECALSATGGYGYQFICSYREPCSEPPTGCVRAAA